MAKATSPADAAPDARGRLVVSLLAEERLSYTEIAGLHDRDVGRQGSLTVHSAGRPPRQVKISEYTKLALDAYFAERSAEPGPLIRHERNSSRGLSVRWLEDCVYTWRTGLDRRRRSPSLPSPLGVLRRQYLAERRAGGAAPTTLVGIANVLARFSEHVGGVEPRKVTRRDVEAFVGRAGLAPASRRSQLSALRTFWRWLVVTGRATAGAGDDRAY